MIAILSPARTIRSIETPYSTTTPRHLESALRLAGVLRDWSPWELETVLRTNPKLALKAFDAYQAFDPGLPGTPAAYSYHGIAYTNLNAADFTREDLAFAGDHLRILSAFYGVLRPLDGILPYRLELVSRLKVDGGNLYAFWGNRIHRDLYEAGETVINLCSAEFAKAVIPHLRPKDRFLTCRFLVEKRGQTRCLATESKAARGQMARYLIKNRLEDPRQLTAFAWEGFSFVPALSSDSLYTFLR